jgi:hypothetical protein
MSRSNNCTSALLNTAEPLQSVELGMPAGAVESCRFPYTDWNLAPFPAPTGDNNLGTAILPNFPDANEFVDDGPTAAHSLDPMSEYNYPPITSGDDSSTLALASTQLPMVSDFRPGARNPSGESPTSSQNTYDQGQHEPVDLLKLPDLQYLANLPHSMLKELSKTVGKALTIAKQKAEQKSRESRQEPSPELLRERELKNVATGVNNILRCEHLGCKTTFRRNKDRLRHARHKHSTNLKTFSCPMMDCPMGLGHRFYRADKLRDHLGGEKIASYQWTCVISGCSEIAASRAGLINHLEGHDLEARKSNYELLRDYGLVSRLGKNYFLARYICGMEGCPFGTDDKASMSGHSSIPHDGPFCPCPFLNCEMVSEDWLSVSRHLSRAHG